MMARMKELEDEKQRLKRMYPEERAKAKIDTSLKETVVFSASPLTQMDITIALRGILASSIGNNFTRTKCRPAVNQAFA